jgi:protoporphyrin/coproporphyrin ferrochelatase
MANPVSISADAASTASPAAQTGVRPGVLLINLGTPAAPESGAVRRYLREFLSDPRVIDLPALARFALVNGVIAPFRAPRSAKAYASIWSAEGSPLLVNTQALTRALQARLRDTPVEFGMRYGEPSMASALERLLGRGVERLLAVPLYPQYASSSTGSSVERLYRLAAERWNTPWIEVLPPFFDAPEFIDALAEVTRPQLTAFQPDHVLLSYHGLPERHVKKSAPEGPHCLARPDCCAALVAQNRWCYRAQCFATSRALIARLGLAEQQVTTAFQSRLGRDPWIQPFSDQVVTQLAQAGVKRLLVLCPSFTADCLETLEEIGERARHDFLAAGGAALELVPCLNAAPVWVTGLAGLIERRLGLATPART